MKLFIAGLPSDFDDVDLREMFELYGTVTSAKVIIDHNTKKSKGFGFLDMANDAEANSVISTLNGVKIAGKLLIIKEATEQASRPAGANGFRPQQRSNYGDARPRFNSNRDRESRSNYNRGDRPSNNRY